MDRSDRFVAGGITFNTTKSARTGKIANIATSQTDSYNHGKSDTNEYGLNIKNPGQLAAKQAGIETVNYGESDASSSDNVAGGTVVALSAVTAVAGANQMSKKLGGKGTLVREKGVLGAAYSKASGAGRSLRSVLMGSKETVNEGYNKPGNDHANYSSHETHNNSPFVDNKTDYTTDSTKTSTPQEQIKSQADRDRAKVRSIDASDAGKMQMRSDLKSAAKRYPKGSPEQTRIRQMQDALDHGENLNDCARSEKGTRGRKRRKEGERGLLARKCFGT